MMSRLLLLCLVAPFLVACRANDGPHCYETVRLEFGNMLKAVPCKESPPPS